MSVPTNPGESDNRAGLAIDRLGSTSHRGLMPKLAAATATRGALSITGYGGTAAIGADPATASVAGALAASDKAKLDTLATMGAWVPLAGSYAANWSDFGGGEVPGAYRYDGLGCVLLRGLVKKGAALALPDTICTLPAGYRPATEWIFACASAGGYAEVRVTTSGAVYLNSGGSASYTSLNNVRFDPAY